MTSEYTELLGKIEEAITSELPEVPSDEWLQRRFGPLSVLPGYEDRRALTAPARALIGRGGKRWRPLLQVLIARVFGSGELALALAPLPEIVHNGTLIVDDIEDSTEIRRGGPAVHRVFGVDAAVNTGNLLYFLPTALLEEYVHDAAQRAPLYETYTTQLRRLHLGQTLDIAWHKDHSRIPSREEYLLMCALKTGALSGLAARIGALSEKAPDGATDSLVQAFEEAGVAFQILDDVRNLRTGNPGKERGDDIVEGKKSLPVILACGKHPELKVRLSGLFQKARLGGASDPSVEEAITTIADTGALEEAEEVANRLLESAKTSTQRVCPPGKAQDALLGIFPIIAGQYPLT